MTPSVRWREVISLESLQIVSSLDQTGQNQEALRRKRHRKWLGFSQRGNMLARSEDTIPCMYHETSHFPLYV